MTEQERRIHDLEQELQTLKMQAGGGGGGGGRGGGGIGGGEMAVPRNLGASQGHVGQRGGGGGMVTPSTVHSTEFGASVNGVAEGVGAGWVYLCVRSCMLSAPSDVSSSFVYLYLLVFVHHVERRNTRLCVCVHMSGRSCPTLCIGDRVWHRWCTSARNYSLVHRP